MKEQIGFIGLGNLGLPMAANLLQSGYSVRVFNRTASKAEPLVAQGAQLAERAVDTITPGGIVVNVLWHTDTVEEMVMRDGFLERLGPGGVHVSMGTGSPHAARKLAALHAEHGSTYLEVPVFGRPEAAVARKLWIPMAGPQAVKDRIRPLLTALGAQGIYDFGEEIGSATIMKLVGSFMMTSAVRSLMEGLAMAEHAGVDPGAVFTMLTDTLFPSPIYLKYGRMIVEKQDNITPTGILEKDLGLFMDVAAEVKVLTPIAARLAGVK